MFLSYFLQISADSDILVLSVLNVFVTKIKRFLPHLNSICTLSCET